LLIEEDQVALVELAEPLLPGDRLQRPFTRVARKIDADNPRVIVAVRGRDCRRGAAPRLHPLPDSIVVAGHVAFASHRAPPVDVDLDLAPCGRKRWARGRRLAGRDW